MEGSGLDLKTAFRRGEWLVVPLLLDDKGAARESSRLKHGLHPHGVRLELMELGLWPAKWLGALLSTGGIRWSDGQEEQPALQLRAFPAADSAADPLLRRARTLLAASGGGYAAEWPETLYEDDWCLVLNKPAGMAVHGSGAPAGPARSGAEAGKRRESAQERRGPAAAAQAAGSAQLAAPATLDEAAACRCVAADDPLPVRHIHRLDDETSGPVLYAKNDLAQQLLDAAMRDKNIGRIYWAAVHGVPRPSSGVIDAPIGRDRHHAARRRVSPGGDHAVTRYKVMEAWPQSALVELTLETGRTHQIRVHMSHAGHPLIGDALYGGSVQLLQRQALHGRKLEFCHPWTGTMMSVDCPLPPDFSRLLERLGGSPI
ncbi:RluA family pseudouridine synthase [Paenibacillus pasadenensis]|uniref:RluA family pseudouridine synthase n=1 Tax=Paenibacillus pasadenensis TaxID=217090 RepID=UPI00203F37A5|nr:RluA family pseudouridine synthase [Paenibacillus pasadenensis]